ncbi:MAG: DNA circularization N-terminal domain-containing protein [Azoarcus sp.]|jgi:prophage DNA circulation protein|nr:DNA circularization N-terminal domain-containing protein [Azoarcus sp.]
MPWTDRLSRARWRDFEFLTDSHSAQHGRRLVVHEYPGADIPLVEDFGEKSPSWELNAYFLGPDYDIARNNLLARLAEPGPDWLNHPWLGLLWARAQDWSISESSGKNGYSTVKITFVHGGETQQPEPDIADLAHTACHDLADAAIDAYEQAPVSASALQGFVATVHQRLEGLRRILSLAALPLAWANTATTIITGLKTDLAEIAGIPAATANAFLGVAHALGLQTRDHQNAAADLPAHNRARVVGRLASAASPARKPVTLTGANITDAALAANLNAEYALEQRLIVAAAISVAVAEYTSEPDRDEALTFIDKSVAHILPAAPDAVFQAAATARAQARAALLGQNLRPTISRDIVIPLPAVLLAHNLGVDVDRFIRQNAVRHPLFVGGRIVA